MNIVLKVAVFSVLNFSVLYCMDGVANGNVEKNREKKICTKYVHDNPIVNAERKLQCSMIDDLLDNNTDKAALYFLKYPGIAKSVQGVISQQKKQNDVLRSSFNRAHDRALEVQRGLPVGSPILIASL